MPDREKVLKGLERCYKRDKACIYCSYHGECCTSRLARDALALLKAQEPVLLLDQHKSGDHFINANSPWKSTCPRCGKKIEGRQTRFCKYCGQAVKWE